MQVKLSDFRKQYEQCKSLVKQQDLQLQRMRAVIYQTTQMQRELTRYISLM